MGDVAEDTERRALAEREEEGATVELPDDPASMTVPQLREIVDALPCDVPKSAPKEALIEAIEAERARRADVGTEEIEGTVVAEEEETVDEAHSQALALREEGVVSVPALLPTTAEFDAMQAIVARIAATQMVPTAYRGKPDDVLAAILTGREMGLGPMQSLRDIYVVDGKPTLSSTLLLSRMREGGVVILESESTAARAWIRAQRRDTKEIAEVEWTIEEAQKIRVSSSKMLTDKDNWKNYPADMLWARCVGRLARRLGSDLIGSVLPYTSEEVQDWPSDYGGSGSPEQDAATWIAPKDWRGLFDRLSQQLTEQDAAAWMEELAEKAYAHPSIGSIVSDPEIEAERKADLWKRLQVVLRTIESSGEDPAFRSDARAFVQKAVYDAFDGTVALLGPTWALTPAEAESGKMKTRPGATPQEGREAAASEQAADEPQEPAEGREARSGAAEEPRSAEAGNLREDEIKF